MAVRAAVVAVTLGSAASGAAPEAWADAGASTFRGQEKRYAPRAIRLDEIRVPRVVVDAPTDPSEDPEAATTFPIERFEVTGNTLLTLAQIETVLTPFVGEGKTLADVERARAALQDLYAADGLLTVAVSIPQQTVADGTIRLDVIEARVARIEVRNDGFAWFSERGIRGSLQHLEPGAVLREEDLETDMLRVNRPRDLSVRPALEAGEELGEVDVVLHVDDRIPLHGSVELHNRRTPGSPKARMVTSLNYTNLFGLGHEVGARYEFVPASSFDEVQIWAFTYRAPMPWNPDHEWFGYVAISETENAAAGASGINVLGEGFNMGFRYRMPLPDIPAWESFQHDLTFGIDRKDVENTLATSGIEIVTPIVYAPISFAWSGLLLRPHAITNLRAGVSFNREGWGGTDGTEQFRINRGGLVPDSRVDGNFEIVSLSLRNTARLPSILRTLAAGQLIDLPEPDRGFQDDWLFDLSVRGQVADQPLISTEQFGIGGVDTVRGYLESELFGDEALNLQFELQSPFFRTRLARSIEARTQLLFFYDWGRVWLKSDPAAPSSSDRLQSFGIGLRAQLFDEIRTELLLANPTDKTQSSGEHDPRLHFSVSAGF